MDSWLVCPWSRQHNLKPPLLSLQAMSGHVRPAGSTTHQLGNNVEVWGLPKWTTLSNVHRAVMKWIYEQWWQDYRRSLRVLIWVMVYVCLRFQSLSHIHLINKADNLVLCFPQVQTVGSDYTGETSWDEQKQTRWCECEYVPYVNISW